MKKNPADASTVVLLRTCPDTSTRDIEVLMVRRNQRCSFVPGFYVFPGGVVDPEDFENGIERFIRDDDRVSASRLLNDIKSADKSLATWVAAIRETFEEVGILFAQKKYSTPVTIRTGEERRRFCNHRQSLIENKMFFSQVLEAEELFLSLNQLHYFSHWITPEFLPLRYDVRFFVAEMPPDQDVMHDGVELTGHVWIRPSEALRQYEQGVLDMVLPQIMTLEDLKHFKTVAEVIDSARKRHISATLTKIQRIGGKDVEVMPDGSVFESRPPVYAWPDKED